MGPAERQLQALAATVRVRNGVVLRVEPGAVAAVVAAGFSPAYGAREIRRVVERLAQAPLAQLLLSGELARHLRWRLSREADAVRLLPDTGGS